MTFRGVFFLIVLSLLGSSFPAQAEESAVCLVRQSRPDDVKRLIGWVFDIAASGRLPAAGEIVDSGSTLSQVPGFGGVTDLGPLQGRYRVMRPAFDQGRGYFGLELAALDADGHVTGLLLLNRLFRLPVVFHQPLGLMTDIGTNGALLIGFETQAIIDLEHAAETALADAEAAGVPLLTAGQSQAGGEAQLQVAYLVAAHPIRSVQTAFLTLNAARVNRSVRRLRIALEQAEGVNFSKDLDPGFGPHGLFPNEIGLQVYIHPDGSGGVGPGDQSGFSALIHPGQHMLAEFDSVSLAAALTRLAEDCR